MIEHRGQFAFDKKESDRRFRTIVWPVISLEMPTFKGFRLMPEPDARAYKQAMRLDRDSNIDFLVESPDTKRPLAIANRVQANYTYRTLTLRASRLSQVQTELSKTRENRKMGYIRAGVHLHSYVKVYHSGEEVFMRAFSVLVDSLFEALDRFPGVMEFKRIWDGNTMGVIDVEALRRCGIEVDEVDHWSTPYDSAEFGPRDVRKGDRWLPWHFTPEFEASMTLEAKR